MRGECYYYLGKYARAVDYLARYREQVEAKGKTLSVYYNGIYSFRCMNPIVMKRPIVYLQITLRLSETGGIGHHPSVSVR